MCGPLVMDFGVRSVPPCMDCDERGHCTMNCGPAILVKTVDSLAARSDKDSETDASD